MRISDWRSDVCSSDLVVKYSTRADVRVPLHRQEPAMSAVLSESPTDAGIEVTARAEGQDALLTPLALAFLADLHRRFDARRRRLLAARREIGKHTSELQSLMRTSSAVFCLKKTKTLIESRYNC